MSVKGISGTSIAIIGVGATLAYSGLKGKNFAALAKALLSGEDPATVSNDPNLAINTANARGSADSGIVPAVTAGSNVVVAAAISQLGKPYVWDTPLDFNDPNPKSFDCSGLTGWCYAKAGIKLAHFTGDQYNQLSHRPFAQALPGDLVFFQNGGNGGIYHVGLYVGNGQIIEAPDAGIPVRYRAITSTSTDIMPNVGAYPGVK